MSIYGSDVSNVMRCVVKICLVLILICIMAYVYSLRRSKERNVIQLPEVHKASETASAPRLHVKGNRLELSDGMPFIIRGVTTNMFRKPYSSDYRTLHSFLTRFETVRSWGANTLQVYLDPAIFDETTPDGSRCVLELQELMDWSQKSHMWIILNPVNDVRWGDTGAIREAPGIAKREHISVFLETLARRYGAYPNVIFGLESEPKFIDSVETVQDRIRAIRQYSQSPIVVPMEVFSGKLDMTSVVLDGIGAGSIILDYHPYISANRTTDPNPEPITDLAQLDIDENLYQQYPIILGEFGGFYESDFNTPEDIIYMLRIGEFARAQSIGFVAYAIDDKLMPMFDPDGTINNRGIAVKKLLRD